MRRCFARLGYPTKPRPVAPERFTTTARLTKFVLVLQMVSRYSVTPIDVLTVSSSVSGTPRGRPSRVGVPGSLEPSQLISSLEAFHNDDASLADSLFF
jgi:hypothetical protein